MKGNYTTIFFLIILSFTAYSQQHERVVVGTAGESISGTGFRTSYTIGEPIIGSVGNSSFVIRQGFQQPPHFLSNCTAYFEAIVGGTLTAQFNNLSTNGKYFWDFGDGQFSSDNNSIVYHSFPRAGFYRVCLSVLDTTTQCLDTYCSDIEIQPQPANCLAVINITGNNPYHCSSANSVGNITNWYWDFGNGKVSVQPNPTVNYQHSGFYTIKLIVHDTVGGCFSTAEQTVSVGNVSNRCNAQFAHFSELTSNRVFFYNHSHGQNATYLWNYGDGSVSNQFEEVHTFPAPGFYNVCLTVWSSNGCSDIKCKNIKVGNNTHSALATFVYVLDSANSNKTNTKPVRFKGTAFGDPAKSNWNIYWEFGDNTYDSLNFNPVHIYPDTGFYLAGFTIQSGNNTASAYGLVNVGSQIDYVQGAFAYKVEANTNKANQRPVSFKGTAFGDPARIMWNFGDGSLDSTTYTPRHYYDPGSYLVCFSVFDDIQGKSDTYCDSLYIADSTTVNLFSVVPEVMFEVFPNPVVRTARIVFRLTEPQNIELSLYNLYGVKIKTFKNETTTAGTHQLYFDRKDLPNGIYQLSLKSPKFHLTRKVVFAH